MSNNQEHLLEKVGVFTPKPTDIDELTLENWIYNYWHKISIRNKVGIQYVMLMIINDLFLDLSRVSQLYFVVCFQSIVQSTKN